ncbi:unnamed protein product [Moneuplotes crassus]|uniref:Uncharacterized protein n=1 Tax=Euplotes crassus TaxID=5936 RepID=A0AAD1U8Q2_EUPCR|nr:unnamed protein product [Moneuplotes crassus]
MDHSHFSKGKPVTGFGNKYGNAVGTEGNLKQSLKGTELKQVFTSKMRSMTCRRMLDIQRFIGLEMDKIHGTQSKNLQKEEKIIPTEESDLKQLFRKGKTNKQYILDILKRLNEKNIKQRRDYKPEKKEVLKSPEIVFSPVSKPSITEKVGFIFKNQSREKRSQVFTPRKEAPPVGFYRPKYDIVDKKNGSKIYFEKEEKTTPPRLIFSSPKSRKKIFSPVSSERYMPISDSSLPLNNKMRKIRKSKHLRSLSPEISQKHKIPSITHLFRHKLKSKHPSIPQSPKPRPWNLHSHSKLPKFSPSPSIPSSSFNTSSLMPSLPHKLSANISIEKYSPRKEIFRTPDYVPNYDYNLKQPNTALAFGEKSRILKKNKLNYFDKAIIMRDDKDPDEIRYQDEEMINQIIMQK